MTGCVRNTAPSGPAWSAAPAPGTFLTEQGRPATAADLANVAAGSRYLLIGEGHTSPCDHAAQAALVEALVTAGKKPAIGLEMIPVDKQPVLDEFNAGRIDVDGLEKAVDWAGVWGYDYAMYAPIFRIAKDNGLPLYALNAPRDLIRQAAESGLDSLAPDKRAMLPVQVIGPPQDQEQALRAQYESHKSIIHQAEAGREQATPAKPAAKPRKRGAAQPSPAANGFGPASFERFMFVQSLWDTQMAERARAAYKASGRPVVILAGGGHVEFGHGIAHRLAVLDPQAKVLSVEPWRGGNPPEPGEADAYFYCPLAHKSRLGFTVETRDGKPTVAVVEPGSRAERAGMRPGDVITAAGGKPATQATDLHKAAIEALVAKSPLVLTVDRAGKRLDLSIPLGVAGPQAAPGK